MQREWDGALLALSISEPFRPQLELDVLYGPFTYPNLLGAYRQETRIDWTRVIRVRVKQRSTPYDLSFAEVWRAPGYVQPPHLLTERGLWQPLLGEVAGVDLEDACYYAVICGVERILDVRHCSDVASYCAALTQRIEPLRWREITRQLQRQTQATWLDPLEYLLGDGAETNPFSWQVTPRELVV